MTSVQDLQQGVASLKLAHESGKNTASSSAEQLSADLKLFLEQPNLQAALADGSLNLANFSTDIAEELEKLEAECIAVYREHKEDIDQLESDLLAVQTVLSQLKEMLLGFQADLGGLSGDIRGLQEKSRTLDIQLRNRKEAAAILDQFLEKVVLSPSLSAIINGTVNKEFVEAVQELQEVYESVHSSQPQEWSFDQVPSQTVAGAQVQKHVAELKELAVTRTREYFLQQILLLRQPQTNVRLIQVHGMLQYAPLYDFLVASSPSVADEIVSVYRESLAATISKLFALYQQQLASMDSTTATKYDVLAMDDAHVRDLITTKVKPRADLFCLGSRATDVTGVTSPIVVSAVQGQKFPYERLLDSLLGHLVQAVTNEYVFGRKFFRQDISVFGPALSILLEGLESYLFNCYDGIAILLMIQVVHKYKRQLQQIPVHTLDGFFQTITQLLWPRLKVIMDAHYRSLEQATTQRLGVDAKSRNAHVVSRRFAEFTCSLWTVLHKEPPKPATVAKSPKLTDRRKKTPATATKAPATPKSPAQTSLDGSSSNATTAGDKLLQDLSGLTEAYLGMLQRLTKGHAETNRLVFAINNIDSCLLMFQERRVTTGRIFTRLVDRLRQERELFVEQELLAGFSSMIAFTSQSEAHLAATNGEAVSLQSSGSVIESLVLDFAANYKSHMSQIHSDVLSWFANFRNGMEVLKQVLTQLLLYYTRFQDVIRKTYQGSPPALITKNLVPTNTILAEIKKYALAI